MRRRRELSDGIKLSTHYPRNSRAVRVDERPVNMGSVNRALAERLAAANKTTGRLKMRERKMRYRPAKMQGWKMQEWKMREQVAWAIFKHWTTPAAVYSRIFHSCIFHPCCLLLHFPLLHFQLPRNDVDFVTIAAASRSRCGSTA